MIDRRWCILMISDCSSGLRHWAVSLDKSCLNAGQSASTTLWVQPICYWSKTFCRKVTVNPLMPTVATCVVRTAIKHPVPDWIKPSFIIFDIWALWRSALSVPQWQIWSCPWGRGTSQNHAFLQLTCPRYYVQRRLRISLVSLYYTAVRIILFISIWIE